jgi:hypothetical protein
MNIETKRTNELTTVVGDFKDVDLKVEYYWDNHGKLINWTDCVEDPNFWSKADVQIKRYSFTENLLGKSFDFEMLQLVVNGRMISGDVIKYFLEEDKDGTLLKCFVTVGWG